MGHWRAQALPPIWENPLPDHQATWQWAWKLGWAKGMVQVIKEGGTLSGHASGLLVGLGVSGHSHSSHLLSGTFPSLSAGAPSWLQPAPMILWAWLPLQRISESHSSVGFYCLLPGARKEPECLPGYRATTVIPRAPAMAPRVPALR